MAMTYAEVSQEPSIVTRALQEGLRQLGYVTGISVRVFSVRADQYFHENYGPAGPTIPGKLVRP